MSKLVYTEFCDALVRLLLGPRKINLKLALYIYINFTFFTGKV